MDAPPVTEDHITPNVPIPEAPSMNPLMQKIRMPGETHQLPSRGLFYSAGELADHVKDGEVHIHPMTTIDELVIRSADKLFSAKGIEEVFLRCIPDVKRPLQLASRDVDFLMACLRKVSYGPEMEISQLHTCDGAKKHDYIINLNTIIQGTKSIDPTALLTKYTTTMKNGQVVKFKPSRFDSVVEILQDAVADNSGMSELDVSKKILIDTILSTISSVDDISDEAMIIEWAENIPAGWLKFELKPIIDAINDFGSSFSSTVNCKDCSKPMEIDIALNPTTFFS